MTQTVVLDQVVGESRPNERKRSVGPPATRVADPDGDRCFFRNWPESLENVFASANLTEVT